MKQDLLKQAFSKIKNDLDSQNQLIKQLLIKISELEDENKKLKQYLSNEKLKTKEDPVKKEILHQISSYKKNFIKNKLLEYISYGNMTISKLKYIFVKDKGYCSKSTFYRYISELKDLTVIVKKDNLSYIFLKSEITKVNHEYR